MVRRVLVLALLAALVAGCGGGDGDDEPPDRTIGFLRAVPNADTAQGAFLEVLAEAGWVDGENLTILAKDPAEAHVDDADEVVAGWLEQGIDLIVALSTSSARVADAAAPDVPVLFLSTDPLAVGLVTDERSPSGHLTGATFRVPADRTLDVAVRALGGPVRFGLLWPADDPAAAPVVDDVRRAAGDLDLSLVDEPFADPADVARAVQALAGAGAEAVVLANAPSLVRAFAEVEAALAAAGLPAVANTSNEFALVTLQPDTDELYRQIGRQAVRLLSGTPVASVPVEDPAGYRIVLDRAAAQRLGRTLPPDVVDLADEVKG